MDKNTKQKFDELKTASMPLIQLIKNNHNPHVHAIVTCTGIELVEGILNIPNVFIEPNESNPKTYAKDTKIIEECRVTGEPTFTLRAKDKVACSALREYIKQAKIVGCSDEFVKEVSNIFDRFANFAGENNDKMKIPD